MKFLSDSQSTQTFLVMSVSAALLVWLAQSDVALPNARQLEFMELEFTQFMRKFSLRRLLAHADDLIRYFYAT